MTDPRHRLVVLGDALLDVDVDGVVERLAPDAPVPVVAVHAEVARPGGAGLAAVLAARAGAACTLVTALGSDAAGRRLADLLAAEGVDVVDVGRLGPTPTKTRVRAGGRVLLRIDHDEVGDLDGPGGHRLGPGEPAVAGAGLDVARAAIEVADAVLVADDGRGVAEVEALRRLVLAAAPRTPVVWDPHPRGPRPVPRVALVTPNVAELRGMAVAAVPVAGPAPEVPTSSVAIVAGRARLLREHWRAAAVAVTRGAQGALLVTGPGAPLVVPAPEIAAPDPCGAGDAFAVHAGLALAAGAVHSEAVTAAVEGAAAFVAAGGAGAVRPASSGDAPTATRPDADADLDAAGGAVAARAPSTRPAPTAVPVPATAADALRLVRSVRAAGGTVVAAGGCFDLLHVGHVRLLEQARQLGDVLVVCLNGDRGVRHLKGAARPVVAERERAEVLAALGCVDAVVVFDEPTPTLLLERLRPHLFVTGGDDGGAELPEAGTIRRWGGEVVTVPDVDGRSSTRLLQEVRRVP